MDPVDKRLRLEGPERWVRLVECVSSEPRMLRTAIDIMIDNDAPSEHFRALLAAASGTHDVDGAVVRLVHKGRSELDFRALVRVAIPRSKYHEGSMVRNTTYYGAGKSAFERYVDAALDAGYMCPRAALDCYMLNPDTVKLIIKRADPGCEKWRRACRVAMSEAAHGAEASLLVLLRRSGVPPLHGDGRYWLWNARERMRVAVYAAVLRSSPCTAGRLAFVLPHDDVERRVAAMGLVSLHELTVTTSLTRDCASVVAKFILPKGEEAEWSRYCDWYDDKL